MHAPLVITVLGAPGTGKTLLVRQLADALQADGLNVVRLADPLAALLQGRHPPTLATLQALCAQQCEALAAAAMAPCDCLVADGSALLAAVGCAALHADATLLAPALRAQRHADLTLLTGLDARPASAWPAQPAWPPAETIDAGLRDALLDGGLGFSVLAGAAPTRLAAARAALRAEQRRRSPVTRPPTTWRHHCGRCGDPDCERHALLPRLPGSV